MPHYVLVLDANFVCLGYVLLVYQTFFAKNICQLCLEMKLMRAVRLKNKTAWPELVKPKQQAEGS